MLAQLLSRANTTAQAWAGAHTQTLNNPTEHNLTQKQFLFCEYLIQTRNGTKSAKLAGYKGKDDNAFAAMASRMLRNDKVQAYLSNRYKEVAMSSDEVLMHLANIARASLSDYCDENGTIDWAKVAKDSYALKSMKRGSKLEFESKLRALELIGKAQSMFTDKLEVAGGDKPITIRVEYSDDYTPPAASDTKGGYRQSRITQRTGERETVGEDAPGD